MVMLGKSMDDGFHRSNAFRKGKLITRIIIYSNKEKALFFSVLFTEKEDQYIQPASRL